MQAAVKQQVRNGQPGKYINITPLWAQVARETTRRAAQTSDYYRNIAENQGALYNGSVPVYSAWLGRYGYNRALKNDEGAPPFLQRYGARSYYTDLVVDALTLALPVKGLRISGLMDAPLAGTAILEIVQGETLTAERLSLAGRNQQEINRTLWNKSVPQSEMNQAEINAAWGGVQNSKTLPGPAVPEYHLGNYTDGVSVNRQVSGDEIFYKHHGKDNRLGKTHNYVTQKQYTSEVDLRNDLAILDEWGIEIDRVTTFKPPKGTWVSEGAAAKQVGDFTDEFRPGSGYQGLIDINNLPKSSWIRTDKLPEGFKQ